MSVGLVLLILEKRTVVVLGSSPVLIHLCSSLRSVSVKMYPLKALTRCASMGYLFDESGWVV